MTNLPASSDRGVMLKLLKSHLSEDDDDTRNEIAAVDHYIDEALDAVDDEEPGLLEWLQTDSELSQVRWANRSALYWIIAKNLHRGKPLDVTVKVADELLWRVLATVAFRAVMRERKGVSDLVS